MKSGDHVMLTCDGRTVEAEVLFVSPNGRALVLRFEAMLHGHVGGMPVWQRNDGSYVSLLGNHPLTITKRTTSIYDVGPGDYVREPEGAYLEIARIDAVPSKYPGRYKSWTVVTVTGRALDMFEARAYLRRADMKEQS